MRHAVTSTRGEMGFWHHPSRRWTKPPSCRDVGDGSRQAMGTTHRRILYNGTALMTKESVVQFVHPVNDNVLSIERMRATSDAKDYLRSSRGVKA